MESFQESGSWVCQSLKIWQKLENKRFCQQSGKTQLSLLDSVSFTGHIAEMSIEMSRALKLVDFYLTRASFWRRQWHPTPVLLPGKSHGRRSLVGCSLEESDTTERLHFHFHALEKEMATHSSVLAWRIPGTEEPGGLPSMGSHRVRHD